MRHPLHLTVGTLRTQVVNAIRGRRRYPFVLMLEPLYACNLACLGCAKERHTGKLKDRLDLLTCLQAADETEAPVVSICGGEPTLYPELEALVRGLVARRRHVILCTNGLQLADTVYGRIAPDKRLCINVHLDGLQATHDRVCDREGVFDTAIEMIREGVRLGHHLMINTTVFRDTDVGELEALCGLVSGLGVKGILMSPGYSYESAPRDIFLTREGIHAKFRRILELSRRFKLTSTPLFLEFAAGLREYRCSPWSTVTRTPLGWKGPCYLIGDRWPATFAELMQTTDWDYWESRQDPRCANCAMHSGFEASVVRELPRHPGDLWRMFAWTLFG